jgi:hypothetical protein
MIDSAPTAKKYRDHALRLREAAKAAMGSDSKAGLLSIARNYDGLARKIESATAARKFNSVFGFGSFF